MGLFKRAKLSEEEKAARKAVYHKDYHRVTLYPDRPERPPGSGEEYSSREAESVARVAHIFSVWFQNKSVVAVMEKGELAVGDTVDILRDSIVEDTATITQIAQFDKKFDVAPEGARVQITFDAGDVRVRKGDLLCRKE